MAKLVVDVDEVYDTNEAARLIGIGYATLYRWIKANKITVVRLGGRTLIPKSEVERLGKNGTPGGEPGVQAQKG